jgi:hypothetical protein
MEPNQVSPDRAVLSRAFSKQRRHQPLDTDEMEALKVYSRERHKLRSDVYWLDLEEKQAMRQRAKMEGHTDLSQWIRDKTYLGMKAANRSNEEWQRQEDRVQLLEKRLAQQLDLSSELANSARSYRQQRDALMAELAQLKQTRTAEGTSSGPSVTAQAAQAMWSKNH